jgi:hypothetical protein
LFEELEAKDTASGNSVTDDLWWLVSGCTNAMDFVNLGMSGPFPVNRKPNYHDNLPAIRNCDDHQEIGLSSCIVEESSLASPALYRAVSGHLLRHV